MISAPAASWKARRKRQKAKQRKIRFTGMPPRESYLSRNGVYAYYQASRPSRGGVPWKSSDAWEDGTTRVYASSGATAVGAGIEVAADTMTHAAPKFCHWDKPPGVMALPFSRSKWHGTSVCQPAEWISIAIGSFLVGMQQPSGKESFSLGVIHQCPCQIKPISDQ